MGCPNNWNGSPTAARAAKVCIFAPNLLRERARPKRNALGTELVTEAALCRNVGILKSTEPPRCEERSRGPRGLLLRISCSLLTQLLRLEQVRGLYYYYYKYVLNLSIKLRLTTIRTENSRSTKFSTYRYRCVHIR
eukprot:SAG31_NODE_23751_length_497_cov_0.791457_1_plen_136_part_00